MESITIAPRSRPGLGNGRFSSPAEWAWGSQRHSVGAQGCLWSRTKQLSREERSLVQKVLSRTKSPFLLRSSKMFFSFLRLFSFCGWSAHVIWSSEANVKGWLSLPCGFQGLNSGCREALLPTESSWWTKCWVLFCFNVFIYLHLRSLISEKKKAHPSNLNVASDSQQQGPKCKGFCCCLFYVREIPIYILRFRCFQGWGREEESELQAIVRAWLIFNQFVGS